MRTLPRRRLLVVSFAVLSATAAPNLGSSEESDLTLSTAVSYFKALYRADYDRVRELSAPEMRFTDPTAEGQETVITSAPNREEFLAYMKANMPPPGPEPPIVINSSFETGRFAVLDVTYRGEIDGTEFGTPGKPRRFETRGVTVLTVEDGKVVHHRDYVDYETLRRQLAAPSSDAS